MDSSPTTLFGSGGDISSRRFPLSPERVSSRLIRVLVSIHSSSQVVTLANVT